MVRVQRYNVILDVADEALNKYMSLGYNQIDPLTGKILNEAIPTDINALRMAWKQHKARIAELEAEIANLSKKQEEPDKPKRSRKPKETD